LHSIDVLHQLSFPNIRDRHLSILRQPFLQARDENFPVDSTMLQLNVSDDSGRKYSSFHAVSKTRCWTCKKDVARMPSAPEAIGRHLTIGRHCIVDGARSFCMMEEWKGERRGGVIEANPKRQERRHAETSGRPHVSTSTLPSRATCSLHLSLGQHVPFQPFHLSSLS